MFKCRFLGLGIAVALYRSKVIRVKLEQNRMKNKGQTLVEVALLLPVVALFVSMSFLFYQAFVQANLYGRTAQNYNYYSVEENQAYGQEMTVALPFP